MTKTALALRHVHFEDLGTFAAAFAAAGYGIRYCDVGIDDLSSLDPLRPDLLIALGGPVGAYEREAYPFLCRERAILAARLASGRPTLGICLGAQLMAAAMGAEVFPSGVKEIGFSALSLTPAAAAGPLRHLAGIPVLHWHGDTFTLPPEAVHLAATGPCRNQAFARGPNLLGLQFHAEVEVAGLERWLIGHAAELAGAGIDPRRLRAEAAPAGPALRNAAGAMIAEWLASLAT